MHRKKAYGALGKTYLCMQVTVEEQCLEKNSFVVLETVCSEKDDFVVCEKCCREKKSLEVLAGSVDWLSNGSVDWLSNGRTDIDYKKFGSDLLFFHF